MKQQEQTPLAYSGKYIDYKSKTYFQHQKNHKVVVWAVTYQVEIYVLNS